MHNEDVAFYIVLFIIGVLIIGAYSTYEIKEEQEAVEACSVMENGNGIYDMRVVSDDYYYIYYCKDYEPVNTQGKQVSKEVYNDKAKEFYSN